MGEDPMIPLAQAHCQSVKAALRINDTAFFFLAHLTQSNDIGPFLECFTSLRDFQKAMCLVSDATQNLSGESYLAKVQDIMSSIMSEQYSAEKNANENVYEFNDSTCFSIAASGEDVCSSGLADIDVCHDSSGNAEPKGNSQINTIEPKAMQKIAPNNHVGNQSNSDQQALKMEEKMELVTMEQSFELEQAREKEQSFSLTQIFEHTMTKKMKEEMKLTTTALRPRRTPSAKRLEADAMRVCGITISLKDSLCLNPGKWLNDTIIDTFILLVKQAQREISFPSYNNWLMPLSLLQQMYQHSFECVKQYTSNERMYLQDFDAVIFVVNHDLHWRTIVMKPKSKTLEVYDSLHKQSHVALSYETDPSTALVMAYVSQEMELNEYDQSSWSMSYMHCPQQQNGFDCGVHVCLHLLALAFNHDITYNSILMDDFRLYIMFCLYKGKLIY